MSLKNSIKINSYGGLKIWLKSEFNLVLNQFQRFSALSIMYNSSIFVLEIARVGKEKTVGDIVNV